MQRRICAICGEEAFLVPFAYGSDLVDREGNRWIFHKCNPNNGFRPKPKRVPTGPGLLNYSPSSKQRERARKRSERRKRSKKSKIQDLETLTSHHFDALHRNHNQRSNRTQRSANLDLKKQAYHDRIKFNKYLFRRAAEEIPNIHFTNNEDIYRMILKLDPEAFELYLKKIILMLSNESENDIKKLNKIKKKFNSRHRPSKK